MFFWSWNSTPGWKGINFRMRGGCSMPSFRGHVSAHSSPPCRFVIIVLFYYKAITFSVNILENSFHNIDGKYRLVFFQAKFICIFY